MSEYISMIDRIFLCNTSEMDACHRVFFTFLPIFSIYKNVKISSQPTVRDHTVFTDYMFHVNCDDTNKPLLIIEVKRVEVSCHIGRTRAFAQMLRELHILAEQLPVNTLLPFILTNSATWGMGYCRVAANKKSRDKVRNYLGH